MRPFSYELRAVRVVLRPGAAAATGAELRRMGVRRPFLVTTPGRESTGRAVAASLEHVAGVFHGARMHVPEATVENATALADRLDADGLVAIGGGSAIGTAKAVALRTGLPILAIPTTYSGSEMTSIWGMTAADGKRTGRDERVAPRVVVYDPLLTLELDALASAASGLNAIAHCVEALYAENANPFASLLAAEGIRVMARSLPDVVRDPRDVEARAGALYAAHLAGRALDMTTMGLHHRLCHVLGGTFDLPHALTHAIVLPHVVAFNAPAAPDAMKVVSQSVEAAQPPGSAGAHAEPDAGVAAVDAAGILHALNVSLGITGTLADLGFGMADIERAVGELMRAGCSNPRPVTAESVRSILEGATLGSVPASANGEA